jgi:hypothetical protein
MESSDFDIRVLGRETLQRAHKFFSIEIECVIRQVDFQLVERIEEVCGLAKVSTQSKTSNSTGRLPTAEFHHNPAIFQAQAFDNFIAFALQDGYLAIGEIILFQVGYFLKQLQSGFIIQDECRECRRSLL